MKIAATMWHTHPRAGTAVESIVHGMTVFVAALREIFDESAYARFLERNRLQSSRDAYAAFLRENGFRRERRARCC